MRGGFASRFAVEAGFLVLLAVGVGFADLRRAWIALVMACGWLLVTAIEWLAWRSARRVEAAVVLPPIRPAQLEEQHGWDVEEILAPLPEEPQGEALTTVLPPEDVQDSE
jgi:hypothetical protein